MTEFRPGRFQVLPPLVKNIMIINVLMVLLQFTLGNFHIDLADYLGLHYWQSSLFRPWQLFTHMFMHGSYNDFNGTLTHIFSNMFALWMFGSVLENVWGPKRFLLFYLICGLGGAACHLAVLHFQYSDIQNSFAAYQNNATLDQFKHFCHQFVGSSFLDSDINGLYNKWLQDPSNISYSNESIRLLYKYIHGFQYEGTHIDGILDGATVGASGAVFGVLFAFGYLFPNTMIFLYFIPVKAKYMVALYAIFELYSGFRNSAGDNIAHFAHLGGMLFAFLLLRIWNKKNRNHFY